METALAVRDIAPTFVAAFPIPGTVERIVTDGAYRLDREIDGLRGQPN